MKTLLIDSPFANLANIERGLRASGAAVTVTADPAQIGAARSLVLPGVGSFAASARWLEETRIAQSIHAAVENGAWLLGVCVGHQLLFDESDEMGPTRGLGLVHGKVARYSTSLPVPQIGWNRVRLSSVPLFEGLPETCSFYFVNSYRATASEGEIAVAEYGERFTAAVEQRRVSGVQFHPEKSSHAGLRVLRNFVEMSQ